MMSITPSPYDRESKLTPEWAEKARHASLLPPTTLFDCSSECRSHLSEFVMTHAFESLEWDESPLKRLECLSMPDTAQRPCRPHNLCGAKKPTL